MTRPDVGSGDAAYLRKVLVLEKLVGVVDGQQMMCSIDFLLSMILHRFTQVHQVLLLEMDHNS